MGQTQVFQYEEVNQQSQTETSDLSESEELSVDDIDDAHNRILSKSCRSVIYYAALGVVYAFFHTNRMSVYLLYANEFHPSQISLDMLLYGFCFWAGIASLIYSSLSNEFGYDVIVTWLTVALCLGVGLEAFATSFWMLCIGILIAQVAIIYIVLGYVAWILPLKYSKQYTSYVYGAFVSSYILGPAASGLQSFFLSNRNIFIVNFIICALTALYCILFIRNTQKVLEHEQLTVGIIDDKDIDEQFPICLETVDTDDSDATKWYHAPSLSTCHWKLLISIIYINCTIAIHENGYLLFYVLYVMNDLHGTVYEGTFGIVIQSFFGIVGNLWIPVLFQKYNIENIETMLYIICAALLCEIMLISLNIFFPLLTFYWVNNVLIGFTLGVLAMSAETVVLIVQPTVYSGKISGARGLLRNWIQAITALCTFIWWSLDHNSLWYVIIIGFMVGLICVVIMLRNNKQYEIERCPESDIDITNNESDYDYYKEISSMEALSPIAVTDEFEVGFHSLYGIMSSIRVVVLLYSVTQFGMRLDRIFNVAYLKNHYKFYLLLLLISSSSLIFLFINLESISINESICIFIAGYTIFYVLMNIYFYFLNDAAIHKFGKVSVLKCWEAYFTLGTASISISFLIIVISSRNASIYDDIPMSVTTVLGLILLAIGVFVKMAACYSIGFNTYFLYDMVLGIPNKYFVEDSIFKYVSNPMYGLGYLNSYGTAIYFRSSIGILCSIIAHCGIWTFYFLNEKPFIKQMYIGNSN